MCWANTCCLTRDQTAYLAGYWMKKSDEKESLPAPVVVFLPSTVCCTQFYLQQNKMHVITKLKQILFKKIESDFLG